MSKFTDDSNAKYAEARAFAEKRLGTPVRNYTEIRNALGVNITAKEMGGFEPSILVEGWAFFDADDSAKVAEAITQEVVNRLGRRFGVSLT